MTERKQPGTLLPMGGTGAPFVRQDRLAPCPDAAGLLAGLFLFCTACSPISDADVRDKLVGSWVVEGGQCEGDADPIIYRRDGTWYSYDLGGSWNVRQNQLIMRVEQRGGYDEPEVAVKPPEEYVSIIQSISADRVEERQQDGSTQILRRCRSL